MQTQGARPAVQAFTGRSFVCAQCESLICARYAQPSAASAGRAAFRHSAAAAAAAAATSTALNTTCKR